MTQQCAESAVSAEEALSTVLHLDLSRVRKYMTSSSLGALISELEAYEVPIKELGGPAYLELCYALVRIVKPSTVIETGVGYGFSSAAILQALRDNGGGQLHSIDLPAFRPGTQAHTGAAVPAALRQSWDLRLGPDRRLLPPLLEEFGHIDVFFYDSDKLYDGMLRSWSRAWPKLRSGGLLIADDVHLHSALFDFAAAHNLAPRIVAKPRGRGVYRSPLTFYQGILRKP
jgi:predicted O-methyltransferase YrrM